MRWVVLTCAAAAVGGILCGLVSLYFVGLVWTVIVLAAFRLGHDRLSPGPLIAFGIGYTLIASPLGYFNAMSNMDAGYPAVSAAYAAVSVLGPSITGAGLAWGVRRRAARQAF